ncbi:MAG: uroporphyrinogen-III synthase [Chitinophagales bacterium]
MKKIKSILISQPEPEAKSPYASIEKKYNLNVGFCPFITIEGVTTKEFRKQRIQIDKFPGVIFTSRNAMEQYFRLCEELRYTISQETKYFCVSEAIALYLQKFIQYRKRKVFYGNGTMKDLQTLLNKHKASTKKFMLPCSDTSSPAIPNFLKENGYEYKEAIMYRTIHSPELEDLTIKDYDMIVFFSPFSVDAMLEKFPDFEQGDTRIAGFGTSTCAKIEKSGFRIDIKAPIPEARSMSVAIDRYMKSLA